MSMNFDEHEFLDDLVNVPWENVEAYANIDEAYQQWKSLFMDVCDKYCPIVSRWVRKTFILWIGTEIKEEIKLKQMYYNKAQKHNLNIYRDLHKKKSEIV